MKKTVQSIFLAFGPASTTVVAALFVLPGAPDSFEGPKRLVWCVFAVGLVVVGLFRKTRTTADGFTAAGWALLGWMALRTFAGPFWRGALPFVAWALPLLILLLASRLRWREVERLRLVRTVAVLGAAEAALMLCQRFGCDPLFGAATSATDYAPGRMIGTIGYQNQAAEFLGVALVCAVAGWRSRAVRIPAAVLFVVTMVLTANRGALFALAATAAVVAVPRLVRSWRTVARAGAVALLAAALLLAVPQTRSRLGELARPSRSIAVQSRIWMGRVALSLWRDPARRRRLVQKIMRTDFSFDKSAAAYAALYAAL